MNGLKSNIFVNGLALAFWLGLIFLAVVLIVYILPVKVTVAILFLCFIFVTWLFCDSGRGS